MGIKLIIKDADFANVAVSKSSNCVLVGCPQSMWEDAGTVAPSNAGDFGYVCPNKGKVVGITINARETYNNGYVRVFEENNGTALAELSINIQAGLHTYYFDNPLEIEDGQIITYRGASTLYAENAQSNYITNNNGGYVDHNPPYRIYSYNFIVATED